MTSPAGRERILRAPGLSNVGFSVTAARGSIDERNALAEPETRSCPWPCRPLGLGAAAPSQASRLPGRGGARVPHFVISGPAPAPTIWDFPEAEVFAIGRAPTCALVLRDPERKVSQSHAAVVRVSGPHSHYFIRDLGSRHSIRVGGENFYQRILRDNDEIEIADYRLLFRPGKSANPVSPRLRFVRSKDDVDGIGGETIASTKFQAVTQADADGQEIIEQFARHRHWGGSAASLFGEFIRRAFNYVRASRGFVAQFISADTQEYEEVEIFGLRPEEQIEITDTACIDRLLRSETVQDHNALLVPIASVRGVRGFICVERRSGRAWSFSSENISFLSQIGELAAECWGAAPSSNHMDGGGDITAWPVGLIGTSTLMDDVRKNVATAAKAKQNVLVLGETGTGKELVARALRDLGCRASAPYIELSCPAIPESLVESELFGKEKGAFTGADRTTKGMFETADGGALLLDDIQELPPAVRPKLYRVLHEKEVMRVGSTQALQVDVFVIGTVETKPDGDQGFARAFTERFQRKIAVPPLRDRREDIPLLVFYFLDGCAAREGKKTRSVSHRAMDLLTRYDWPGNVRELRNCIENAVMQDTEVILSSDLPPAVTAPRPDTSSPKTPQSDGEVRPPLRTLAEIEKEAIQNTLTETGGNIARSARVLAISEMGLRNKMKSYDIRPGYGRDQR